MDRSITIRIAGKEYVMKVREDMEPLMRIASETINQKLQVYDAKFPGKELTDKLVFVTLNETMARISLQKKLAACEEDGKKLSEDMKNYLDKIEKQ